MATGAGILHHLSFHLKTEPLLAVCRFPGLDQTRLESEQDAVVKGLHCSKTRIKEQAD